MEDKIIVPVPASVVKAEVCHHVVFWGNVRPGTAARAQPRLRRLLRSMWRDFVRGVAGGSVSARLQLSLMLGAVFAVGAVLALRSRRFYAEH